MTDLNDLLVSKTFVALHSEDKIGLRFIAEMYFLGSLEDSRDLKVKEEICLYVSLFENQRQLHALYKSQLGTLVSSKEILSCLGQQKLWVLNSSPDSLNLHTALAWLKW